MLASHEIGWLCYCHSCHGLEINKLLSWKHCAIHIQSFFPLNLTRRQIQSCFFLCLFFLDVANTLAWNMPPKTFVKLWFTRAESLRCSGVMSRRHFGKTCLKYPRLSMSHVTGETLFRFVGCFVSRWISAKSMHGFKRCQSWSNFLRESKDLGFGPPRHIGFQAKARQTLLIVLSERRFDCKTSTFRSVSAVRIQVLVPSLWRHQKHRHNLRLSGQ